MVAGQPVEKSIADWILSGCIRSYKVSAEDKLTIVAQMPADSADPWPFGTRVVLQVNRQAANATTANGLPISGVTAYSGGHVSYIGFRNIETRGLAPNDETVQVEFVDAFTFFFSQLVFCKSQFSYNGHAQVNDPDPECILGLTLIPSGTNTNYLTIHQQLCEIAAYAAADSSFQQSTNGLGWPAGAQFQFDALTTVNDGTNYDLHAGEGGTANCGIPDYVPGTYGSLSGNNTSANPNGLMLRASLDNVNNAYCDDVWRRTLVPVGDEHNCAVWFDYSTAPPTLKITTRDKVSDTEGLIGLGMPAVTLPWTAYLIPGTQSCQGGVSSRITRRDDLVPPAVHLRYKVSGSFLGQPYNAILNDIAATIGGVTVEGAGLIGALTDLTGAPISGGDQTLLQEFGATGRSIRATVDLLGASTTAQQATIFCINLDLSGGDGFVSLKQIFPKLVNASSLGLYAGFQAHDPETDAVVDISAYPYLLKDPGAAPWMLDGSTAASAKRIVIRGSGRYLEASGYGPGIYGSVDRDDLDAHVTVINVPSGTYTSSPRLSEGEPIPYGLSGYMFNIAKLAQHEGTYKLIEHGLNASGVADPTLPAEVTDQFPPGNLLNLSGGLVEWTNMNAYAPQIAWDYVAGTTEVTMGPASHLGAKDWAERMARDRGPRFLYLFSTNPLNTNAGTSGATDLLNNNAQTGRQSGAVNHPWKISATTASDVDNLGSYYNAPGFPGMTIDARTSGQPNYSNQATTTPSAGLDNVDLPTPNGQTIWLAESIPGGGGGTGDAIGRFARLSVTDIPIPTLGDSSVQSLGVSLRPFRTGELCSNTSWRVFLCGPCYDNGSWPPSPYESTP